MTDYKSSFQDCYVMLEGNGLIIGNNALERIWDLGGDIPEIKSLKNKRTGKEWLSVGENYDWLSSPEHKYAFYHSCFTAGGLKGLSIESDRDDDCGIGRIHMRITVNLEYADYLIRWIHMVYPGTALLRSCIQVRTKDNNRDCQTALQTPVQGELFCSPELTDDYQDAFPLEPAHCSWKSVQFIDRTDDYDNLVHTRHGLLARRESRYMHGNLLQVEDRLTGEGATFIKEGPTPLAYLGNTKSDFYVKGQNVFVTGWGFGPDEVNRAGELTSYGGAVLLWDGEGTDADSALHEYHNAMHVFVPEKDAFVMSNTWGDQSCDGRLSEEFLLAELKKAEEVGITFYQIDDGWQKGTTSNSVLPGGVWGTGYYKENPDFWKVNPLRFPNGLEPVAASAKEKGIRLGLWFSPDSMNDFENWERDSHTLIDLHRRYGISAFKMDGVKLKSKIGEENLTRLLKRVITETQGKVFFNMDVTAEVRSGYFGRLQYGSLFVENRFTGVFGAYPNYYPHCTLRNLWMLSRYYPTNRLQMEFLNVKKNAGLYGGDVLSPASCGLEYSFAVTMFANPLAWLETTGLDEESAHLLGDIIPRYQKFQSDILQGHVLPVGDEPDGTRWTGFQSIKNGREGYLLIIREYNQETSHRYRLHRMPAGILRLQSLLGAGAQTQVQVDEECQAVFELEGQLSYALYRYKVETE